MDNMQPNTGKIALKYGLILGAIGIIFNLMLYSQNLHYQVDLQRIFITVIIGLVLVVLGSIFAMKEFKKGNNGLMSISQGLKLGVGLSLISGIIGVIFGFVMSEVIDPDLQEKAINFAVSSMREAGMSEDQIAERMKGQKDPNIPVQIGGYMIFSIVLGFLGSIIPALALKKQEDTF